MFETQNEIAERNRYICSAVNISNFSQKSFSQQLINGWCENDEWGRQKINYSSMKDFKLSIHETSNLIVLAQFFTLNVSRIKLRTFAFILNGIWYCIYISSLLKEIWMMHVSHATVRTNFSSTRSSVSLTSWIMAHVSHCWLVGYNPFLLFFPSHASNNNKSKLTCDHVKQTFKKIIDEIYLKSSICFPW